MYGLVHKRPLVHHFVRHDAVTQVVVGIDLKKKNVDPRPGQAVIQTLSRPHCLQQPYSLVRRDRDLVSTLWRRREGPHR